MTRIDQIQFVYPENELFGNRDETALPDIIGKAQELVLRSGMKILHNDEIKEVAIDEGNVVGILCMTIDPSAVNWSVAVDPEYSHSDIAKHLYSTVIADSEPYIDSGNPFTLRTELNEPYSLEPFVKSLGYVNTGNDNGIRTYEKKFNVPLDESVEDPAGWLSVLHNVDVMAYHGSESKITTLDFSRAGKKLGDSNLPSMFFTDSKINADFYGDNIYKAKLHFTKLLSIDDPDEFDRLNKVVGHKLGNGELDIHEDIDMDDIVDVILTSINSILNISKSVMYSGLGYDGVVFRNVIDGHLRGNTYAVFDKSVIQSFSHDFPMSMVESTTKIETLTDPQRKAINQIIVNKAFPETREIARIVKNSGYDIRDAIDFSDLVNKQVKKGYINTDWLDAVNQVMKFTKPEKIVKNKNIMEKAQKVYGLTSDPSKGGYITPTAKFLDFSEGGGRRTLDHRNVDHLYDDDFTFRIDAVNKFMDQTGCIRWIPEQDSFDMRMKPTSQQMAMIRRLVGNAKDDVSLDMYSPAYHSVARIYPKGINPMKVIGDINRFYSGQELSDEFLYESSWYPQNEYPKHQTNEMSFRDKTIFAIMSMFKASPVCPSGSLRNTRIIISFA